MIKDTAEHHLQCKIDIITGICRFKESEVFSLSLKKTCSEVTISHNPPFRYPKPPLQFGIYTKLQMVQFISIIKEIKEEILTSIFNTLSLARCYSLM